VNSWSGRQVPAPVGDHRWRRLIVLKAELAHCTCVRVAQDGVLLGLLAELRAMARPGWAWRKSPSGRKASWPQS
jgi:hypothetical protein